MVDMSKKKEILTGWGRGSILSEMALSSMFQMKRWQSNPAVARREEACGWKHRRLGFSWWPGRERREMALIFVYSSHERALIMCKTLASVADMKIISAKLPNSSWSIKFATQTTFGAVWCWFYRWGRTLVLWLCLLCLLLAPSTPWSWHHHRLLGEKSYTLLHRAVYIEYFTWCKLANANNISSKLHNSKFSKESSLCQCLHILTWLKQICGIDKHPRIVIMQAYLLLVCGCWKDRRQSPWYLPNSETSELRPCPDDLCESAVWMDNDITMT